ADRLRVEQDHVGPGARREPSALRQAIYVGRVAREFLDRTRQREALPRAHPVAEEMHPELGVAEKGVMRAGIGKRDEIAVDREQLGDFVFLGVEWLRGERRLEALGKSDIEERVERIGAALARYVRDRAPFEHAVLRPARDRDLHAVPMAVEEARCARTREILARYAAEFRVGVGARQRPR